MRTIRLTEYETTSGVPLEQSERDTLRQLVPTLAISPTPGTDGLFDLTPGGSVGIVSLGDLQIELRPRLPVEQILFLLTYGLDRARWQSINAHVGTDDNLVEAIVPVFIVHLRHVLRNGLLHGYRRIDEADTTIRGRIRLVDQMRIRPGLHLPVELTRDEFSPDILENQLLLAAIDRLARLPLRSDETSRQLREMRGQFMTVSRRTFTAQAVPEPHWTRLNMRYRPAVDLARVILQGGATQLVAGARTGTGVTFDMPSVFENFVAEALRDELGLTPRAFPSGAAGRRVFLDRESTVRLEPDLSWWIGKRPVFVGDCKYKRASGGVPNADLYQLLAYVVALDLDDGLLIYAAGETDITDHTIHHAGKTLRIRTLRLTGSPRQILEEVADLAEEIRGLAWRNGGSSNLTRQPSCEPPRELRSLRSLRGWMNDTAATSGAVSAGASGSGGSPGP